MTKVKDLKILTTNKRAKISVASLMLEVRKKFNERQVSAVTRLLEQKYDELEEARKIVNKLESQLKILMNKDIEEIDASDYDEY
jgi:hypothetical protein